MKGFFLSPSCRGRSTPRDFFHGRTSVHSHTPKGADERRTSRRGSLPSGGGALIRSKYQHSGVSSFKALAGILRALASSLPACPARSRLGGFPQSTAFRRTDGKHVSTAGRAGQTGTVSGPAGSLPRHNTTGLFRAGPEILRASAMSEGFLRTEEDEGHMSKVATRRPSREEEHGG